MFLARPVGGSPWGQGACPLPTGLLLPAVGLATWGVGGEPPAWSPASSAPPPTGLHLAHLPYCPLGCRQRWVNPEERMWRSGSPIWSQVGTSTSPALRAARINWKPHCLLPLSPHCPPPSISRHCPPSLSSLTAPSLSSLTAPLTVPITVLPHCPLTAPSLSCPVHPILLYVRSVWSLLVLPALHAARLPQLPGRVFCP